MKRVVVRPFAGGTDTQQSDVNAVRVKVKVENERSRLVDPSSVIPFALNRVPPTPPTPPTNRPLVVQLLSLQWAARRQKLLGSCPKPSRSRRCRYLALKRQRSLTLLGDQDLLPMAQDHQRLATQEHKVRSMRLM